MAFKALVLLALISYTAAAPWRCCTTCDGSTICIGEQGQPSISPPYICLSRPCPPCTGPATVYTPCQNPNSCPCPPPPNPCPEPCRLPCPQPSPCDCNPPPPCDFNQPPPCDFNPPPPCY